MEDEWTVDANEAVNISLVRPTSTGLEAIASFKPRFTHAIFGEEERIFGYQGLEINLKYDSRDLRPNLTFSLARKFDTVDDIEAVDIKEELMKYLPAVAFQSKREYERSLNAVPDHWTPPGLPLKTMVKDGEVYEIWCGKLNDPAVKQLVKRIQIAVLFFIDGGSYIGEDAEGKEDPEYSLARWSVLFVYKKDTSQGAYPQYTFQGYATVYNFWMLDKNYSMNSKAEIDDQFLSVQNSPVEKLPHRQRISQFLILPPFQGKGLGTFLYDTIFTVSHSSSSTREITVEDPNEDFDLLRDLCDLKYLREHVPEFDFLEINSNVELPAKGGVLKFNTRVAWRGKHREVVETKDGIVDLKKLEGIRVQSKIAPRQFSRLVEMHLMSKLPESVRPQSDPDIKKPAASKADKHTHTLWRLLVKQRVYRRNVDVLGQLESHLRIPKLNETVDNVEWEYARILDRLSSKSSDSCTFSDIFGRDDYSANEPIVNQSKRKLNGDAEAESSRKKARVWDGQ